MVEYEAHQKHSTEPLTQQNKELHAQSPPSPPNNRPSPISKILYHVLYHYTSYSIALAATTNRGVAKENFVDH